jgi:hypothetical protein
MTMDSLVNQLVRDQKHLCNKMLLLILPWILSVILLIILLNSFKDLTLTLNGFKYEYRYVVGFLLASFSIILVIKVVVYWRAQILLVDYRKTLKQFELVEHEPKIEVIRKTISDAQSLAINNHLVNAVLKKNLTQLNASIAKIRQTQLRVQLKIEVLSFENNCDKKLAVIKNKIPLVKARANIISSLQFLGKRREEIIESWHLAYEQFSWWNKLKYDAEPDLSEMNHVYQELERMGSELDQKYCDDFKRLNEHFELLKTKALSRVLAASENAEYFIQASNHQDSLNLDLLKKSFFLSALSLPVSVWSDVDKAGNVYDALRTVNGNYLNMADADIWWETLFLSPLSLVGLTSLTKGAYLEQLIAADTGGELFEHFNHPGSDIVIDGVEYQIKATDSTSYINSVADDIPVISTSEVAFETGALDSGYTNEELTNTVDLAMGGTVVDVGDSVVDAIFAGVGGLGLFATIQGINHAVSKHKNGGDGAEAMFDGAGVAIEGTARAFVGAAELSYKALASKPSRFVGRTLLKGLGALEKKIMGE